MLALTTLAAALFVRAVKRESLPRAIVAGLTMGAASWVKVAAFMAVPGVLVLGLAMSEPGSRRAAVRLGIFFTAVALLVQLPWEFWQWAVVGSPFPTWAGKPSATLIAQNAYIRWVTVTRSQWVYLTLMPRVVWTLVPSIACLAGVRPDRRTVWIAGAALLWIAAILAVLIALGAAGYSKLLRYAILVTPATVLLAGLAAGAVFDRLAEPGNASIPRPVLRGLAILLVVALGLEISQGFMYSVLAPEAAVILPIVGPGDGTW
jgi:4-amino-4-deoxy-L-arabinose transferase-like glycosyltransferase